MFHYGHMVRVLHCAVSQSMTAALGQMELTSAQGRIMGYLARQKQPPCAKDIETEFHLSHPTVSGLLSRLEQKGFVELRRDPEDGRCKRIYVLPKGKDCQHTLYQTILSNENQFVQGFSSEERAMFRSMLQRAIDNMRGACAQTEQEESKP